MKIGDDILVLKLQSEHDFVLETAIGLPAVLALCFVNIIVNCYIYFSFLDVNGNLCVFLEVISGVIKSMYVSNISKSPGYTHLSC